MSLLCKWLLDIPSPLPSPASLRLLLAGSRLTEFSARLVGCRDRPDPMSVHIPTPRPHHLAEIQARYRHDVLLHASGWFRCGLIIALCVWLVMAHRGHSGRSSRVAVAGGIAVGSRSDGANRLFVAQGGRSGPSPRTAIYRWTDGEIMLGATNDSWRLWSRRRGNSGDCGRPSAAHRDCRER